MNVGNIGNAYGAYNYTNKVQNNSGKSFGAAIGNVTDMSSPNLTLHMSKDGDAEKSVSSWANANTGQSITVYQPEDYDPANPVYKMKTWDKDDNLIEERNIDINSIDPNNADSYEMYALSVYGEKSGICPDAVTRFMMMHAKQEAEQRAQTGSYSLDIQEKWLDILNNFMKEQLDMGFMDGYLKNKAYLGFLTDKQINTWH